MISLLIERPSPAAAGFSSSSCANLFKISGCRGALRLGTGFSQAQWTTMKGLAAAPTLLLNRRTGHRPKRAEHAAIALFRSEDCLARRTFPEKLAAFHWHLHLRRLLALGAGHR